MSQFACRPSKPLTICRVPQHSGVSSVQAGLDMTMPGDIVFFSNTTYFGANLTEAVRNGSVPMSRVDDMATRIVGAWFLVGQDQGFPEVNFDSFHVGGPNNSRINVQDNHRHLIRKIGSASTVLLKNVNHTLPLKAPYSIALIGSDAGPSSLMIWLICLPRNFWMNQGATRNDISMAVIVAMIARNGV